MYVCPICEFEGSFESVFGREQACCPRCGSVERHRLDWLFCKRRTSLFDGEARRLLHLAPEPCLCEAFGSIPGIQVLTGDLSLKAVDVRLDLTEVPLVNGGVDVVYCSHVLEHIEDDSAAIAEIYRIVRPGGWALLQVPVKANRTWESPEAKTAEERKRVFGQYNHVRVCGPDYADRYRAAGFDVEVLRSTDVTTTEECRRYRFQEDRYIFYCSKAS